MSIIINRLKLVLLLLITFIILTKESYSQVDYYFFTGARKGKIDTLAKETSDKVTKESTGILEKPIDTKTYFIGPNDILTISIISAESIEKDITVSPEGKVVIPNVGAIDVKNKTLHEADSLIRERIYKVYKSKEVFVVLKDLRKFKVSVSGSVLKPSIVTATAVDRVSEVIEKAGGLKYDASMRRILLYRNDNAEVIKVDLLKYFMLGFKEANPTVLGGDHIIVPPSNENQALRLEGEVGMPGTFEFVEGDSLSSLLRFGQGFLQSALLDSVEFARFKNNTITSEIEFLDISNWKNIFNSGKVLDGDFPLKSGDRVYIRKQRDWQQDNSIVIEGAVYFPGWYAINEGKDKVSDIIRRAGGFKPNASLERSLLIRRPEEKIVDEDPVMKRLRTIPPSEMSENEMRYFQSKITEIKGVMSIDFKKIVINENTVDNIFLMNNDSLNIAFSNEFINVQGRVNNPGNVIFNKNYTYEDYIALAGGYGFRADEGATLIVKSKGQQFDAKSKKYILEPGDYILVPPETEKTFFDYFTTTLTITMQLVTIVGVVISLVRLN